jgi:enamine deaminase RidA (YjgF/YER057c/UK114 family)
MTLRSFAPASIRPPFGRYSHGMEIPAGWRLLLLSGQLGITAQDTVPEDAGAQADLCFAALGATMAEAGMGPEHVVRVNAYLTDVSAREAYMAARDRWLKDVPQACMPASTLLIVAGLVRPEFKVEVEVTAAAPAR